jgi:pilus assembly protein CpaC
MFMDSQGRQIGNLEITVGTDVNELNQTIAQTLPGSRIRAQALNDGVLIGGSAASLLDASKAQDLAARTVGDEKKVVNTIQLDQRQQVLIKVRVSEMSRSIAKQLGINASSISNAAGVPIVLSTENQFGLLGRALSDLSGAQFGQVCQGQQFGFSPANLCNAKPNNLQSVVQALERVGLVHTLAEPNLTAVSGESAKFLAGGEFPVPTSRDRDGNVTVEFKQFGVGLGFRPVVLNDGRISLQLSTEVSELTNTGALTLGGGTVTDDKGNTTTVQGLTLPALSVRRAETSVDLPSGGSLAIGGLIQQQTKQSIDAFPGLKELPVLGALFRSRDYQKNETELVVTVTAYIVEPVSETKLATPDQGFVPPSDVETILMGRLNKVYGKDKPVAESVPKGTIGYIVQ